MDIGQVIRSVQSSMHLARRDRINSNTIPSPLGRQTTNHMLEGAGMPEEGQPRRKKPNFRLNTAAFTRHMPHELAER